MLDKQMQDLVEYLSENNMERKVIQRVIQYQFQNPRCDFLSSAKTIYEIFGFIKLSDDEIQKLIVKKLSLLKEPKQEICKIAYVFKEANLGEFIFELNSVLEKVKNYKRIFMRHMMCKNVGVSPTSLMAPPKKVYNEYRLCEIIHSLHNVWIFDDEELEDFLNQRLKLNGNPVNVDQYIEVGAKLLYSEYLKSKRTINNDKGAK